MRNFLKVSSTPVREAFHQLEADGLLTRRPNSGAKVAEVDISDTKDFIFFQSLLQAMAVQICTNKLKKRDVDEAERLNNKMHGIVQKKIDMDKLRILNYEFH